MSVADCNRKMEILDLAVLMKNYVYTALHDTGFKDEKIRESLRGLLWVVGAVWHVPIRQVEAEVKRRQQRRDEIALKTAKRTVDTATTGEPMKEATP